GHDQRANGRAGLVDQDGQNYRNQRKLPRGRAQDSSRRNSPGHKDLLKSDWPADGAKSGSVWAEAWRFAQPCYLQEQQNVGESETDKRRLDRSQRKPGKPKASATKESTDGQASSGAQAENYGTVQSRATLLGRGSPPKSKFLTLTTDALHWLSAPASRAST